MFDVEANRGDPGDAPPGRRGEVKAAGILARLEAGTDALRAAIAAVPDDALRTSLEHEVDGSLRPLHELGRDILILAQAGRAIAMMAESSIKTALAAFISQAGQDIETFKKSVCSWFNDVMDHASGWYKRNTQRILFVIAMILCVTNNVDKISLVGHLSTDPQMRAAAAKEAREFLELSGTDRVGSPPAPGGPPMAAANSSEVASRYKEAVDATTLPLWWTKSEWDRLLYTVEYVESQINTMNMSNRQSSPSVTVTSTRPVYRFSPNYSWLLAKFTGLLISTLAVSMGAPFRFDLLNKLVNVRLAGKRPDPSDAAAPPPAGAPPNPIRTRTTA